MLASETAPPRLSRFPGQIWRRQKDIAIYQISLSVWHGSGMGTSVILLILLPYILVQPQGNHTTTAHLLLLLIFGIQVVF